MRTRNILIGCGVLLILCIAASGIGFVLIGPSIGKVVNTVTQGPYQIGARPLPADGNQDTLLPPSVGEFQRGDVQTANNTFTTTYTSGSTTINASAEAFDNMTTAHAAIQSIKDKGSGNGNQPHGNRPELPRGRSEQPDHAYVQSRQVSVFVQQFE